MRSLDSTISGQHRQKNEGVVQPSLLTLFPSLNYSRTDIHANTSLAMQTKLKVLFKAAEEGSITKYQLTKPTAEPRLGGGSAENALRDLKKMQLLSVNQSTSATGSQRNDYYLTAKGFIVCLVFKKYQTSEIFSSLVKRLDFAENELAFTLLLYNRFSPKITDILEVLAAKGLNFERLTNEELVLEIRKTADLIALQSNNNPLQFVAELLMDAPETTLVRFSRDLIGLSKDLKELFRCDPEGGALIRKMLPSVLAGFFSWITSPEVRLWMITQQDVTELHSLLDNMKAAVINDKKELPHIFDAMRDEIIKQLKQRIEVKDYL